MSEITNTQLLMAINKLSKDVRYLNEKMQSFYTELFNIKHKQNQMQYDLRELRKEAGL